MTKSLRGTKNGILRRVGITALGVTLLAGVAAPTAAAGQHRPELQRAAQEFVDAGFGGMQLRVRDERGEWTGSAGVRELGGTAKPPTNGHFRVGSTTKNFTATLVLQLVAEGRIGLDTPVAGFLPQFGLDRRITVRMLLQHTSGLFNHTGQYYPDGTVTPGIPWSGQEWVDKRFHTYRPEELVRLSVAKPLLFEPGASWSYSNTNYVVARLLVEKLTGHSFAIELDRRIVRPLKLRDTLSPNAWPGMPKPYAHAYYRYENAGQWKTVDVTHQNPSWISSAGDMISTTKDLQTYFSALQSGKLLPATLLAEMRKTHPQSESLYGYYGLGQFTQDLGPGCVGTVLNHNGGLNGYGSLMYSTPDGSKTLTASITGGDAASDPAQAFPAALNKLLKTVFCGE
ncbi:serine hydrolase domain-containing protein [Amycolatopsis regifaucium]|uniref:Alkaline D-peptidase n=1 Tax=Amycolatopsis regifaucium TaxID=546365 RepID=A0A154MLS4_9PSEU|nr:serine hydrolase domain-containing protein [Amycolatopsis regifaucium]KZB85252.1 alkaline D-peptidase [Amycolatopsis regifaucium]OKA04227.1 alkaline D-peptidase [Amycolatopsis regifaucium]SFH99513.1 D-alanyl-D-alanine carboxypeptidase [Amycolatopsis regifaucium]